MIVDLHSCRSMGDIVGNSLFLLTPTLVSLIFGSKVDILYTRVSFLSPIPIRIYLVTGNESDKQNKQIIYTIKDILCNNQK